jgi:hypothetical protein
MVETGTNYGHTSWEMKDHFTIHTIELSGELYRKNVEKFKDTNVKCYWGDSKSMLPKIIKDIYEPILFYLDAHYSGGLAAFGEEECPLLQELEIISHRKYNDIIICDDLRLFGSTGKCGCNGCEQYPSMEYDWRDISIELCRKAIGYAKEEQKDDRLIFYMEKE